MVLNKQILGNKLKSINQNRNLKQLYTSKWKKMVNFLYNNTNLSIAKIAKAGSIAKNTDLNSSDLDLIFSISPDTPRNQVYSYLLEILNKSLKNTANISLGKEAIHVDYRSNNICIDLVLKSQSEFNREHKGVKDIRQLNILSHDAIKLVKYALGKAGIIDDIHGYRVEKMIFSLNSKSLIFLVEKAIEKLKFDIRNAGKNVSKVLIHLK